MKTTENIKLTTAGELLGELEKYKKNHWDDWTPWFMCQWGLSQHTKRRNTGKTISCWKRRIARQIL